LLKLETVDRVLDTGLEITLVIEAGCIINGY